MNSFTQSTSFFGGSNPEELARSFGTPLYVYNEAILRDRMRHMQGLIRSVPFTANYSIKTNSNLTLLRIALEEGLSADAMSPGEIEFLLRAGFPQERIFYVANNVSDEELRFAIDRGIMTSLDSVSQLERFGRLNPNGKCALRLNPGVGAGHHEKVITAGKKTKFAIAQEDIDHAKIVANKYNLKIVGVNQHIGSLFMDATPYLQAIENFLQLAKGFEDLEFVDFGGGFGIPYRKLSGEKTLDIDATSKALDHICEQFAKEYGKPIVFKIEPGRYIAAESCVLIGRVHSLKQNAGVHYVGTDIGMNVLVRPSMYGSWHDIEVYRDGEVLSSDDQTAIYTVVGNICETGDILAKDRTLPIVRENDLLVVLDAGAYGYCMSSNYNNRLKAAEVMIGTDGLPQLIRRRQTLEDLFREFPGF
ncbi:MAG: diaminopimelate decarboxylase [Clostridiaceae bacterium]|nr:diaminopimelate decarboxylase [Clostridiaceae bacterium]